MQIFSRNNPSSYYIKFIEQYRDSHRRELAGSDMVSGAALPERGLLAHIDRIKWLIQSTGAQSLLDYGSGNGRQYHTPIVDYGLPAKDNIMDYWGLTGVELYDPCLTLYSSLPRGSFDGVVCTNVLQSCAEDDIPWIVNELFSLADKFLFVSIECYMVGKTLGSATELQCTNKDSSWWMDRFKTASVNAKKIEWEVVLGYLNDGDRVGSANPNELFFRGI